ncbi:MAG: hypothetical protein AB1700_13230 [Bacillota bacterium]
MSIKATPYPIYEIYKGLERYFGLFRREESIWALCRYVVGLLADIARKTCEGLLTQSRERRRSGCRSF